MATGDGSGRRPRPRQGFGPCRIDALSPRSGATTRWNGWWRARRSFSASFGKAVPARRMTAPRIPPPTGRRHVPEVCRGRSARPGVRRVRSRARYDAGGRLAPSASSALRLPDPPRSGATLRGGCRVSGPGGCSDVPAGDAGLAGSAVEGQDPAIRFMTLREGWAAEMRMRPAAPAVRSKKPLSV